MLLRMQILCLALFCAANAANAQNLAPLADNQRVQDEFLAAAVGDSIRKNCPDISARLFRVLRKARELEAYAISLGYSQSDIKAMRTDPAAKRRLASMRNAYLRKNGVTPGQSDSYCRLGRQEIRQKSLIGWLLRAN